MVEEGTSERGGESSGHGVKMKINNIDRWYDVDRDCLVVNGVVVTTGLISQLVANAKTEAVVKLGVSHDPPIRIIFKDIEG